MITAFNLRSQIVISRFCRFAKELSGFAAIDCATGLQDRSGSLR
ncbi:hypothetical protein HY3_09230 [Hyphomonas pacifica]|uniref:Uncharacterized protein n=1 Tax=Hyphomonas pacifica TaxID=1280941 RepID=A0A8B2PT41_9PROT|nr:hypothetical protein HY3_09230 [Hyphomonas pacifica]